MSPFKPSDWRTIKHHGRHFAVLFYVYTHHAILVYATSTRRSYLPHIEVDPTSSDGRRLHLEFATYFYPQNCIPVRLERIDPKFLTRCPPQLYRRLRELCQVQLASLENYHSVELLDVQAELAAK